MGEVGRAIHVPQILAELKAKPISSIIFDYCLPPPLIFRPSTGLNVLIYTITIVLTSDVN